jgi:hypothetical protein
MGHTSRHLVAKPGGVEKLSTAKLHRVWLRGEQWAEYAGQELKVMEVALEVERTKILRVVRVLPYRTRFDADGRPHPDELWNAKKRMARTLEVKPPTAEEQIAHLQEDASHFWEPTESEWAQAAELLGVRVSDLLEAKWRPPGEAGHGGTT